ncbi:MAG: DUF2007 domain-containing protein [Thermodesulfobacteriota bacterium]
MPFCPNPNCLHLEEVGEPAEYVDGIWLCGECGAELVAERPFVEPEREPRGEERDLVEVFILRNPLEAEVVRDALQDNDITCQIRENLGGVVGGALSSGWGEVLVAENDAERAQRVIEQAISELEGQSGLADTDESELAEHIEPADIAEMAYPAVKPRTGFNKKRLAVIALGLLVLERLLVLTDTISSSLVVPVLLAVSAAVLLSLKD